MAGKKNGKSKDSKLYLREMKRLLSVMIAS